MPRELTDEMLNQIKYVSMADYMRRVDRLTDLEDKLAFTTRYLLSYGAGEGRDHTLAEAIHIARMKIASLLLFSTALSSHCNDFSWLTDTPMPSSYIIPR